MKKVTILCMIVLAMLTSAAFAASNIDTERWFWTASNDKETWYIDKTDITYNPETDTCKTWLLRDIPSMKVVAICNIEISYVKNEMDIYDYVIFEYNNTTPVENGVSNTKEKIFPNSMMEVLKNKSLTLINRDEELAKYKEQQEAEAKQAEQKQKDKEKEQRNKEIANTAIGIIGGLF